MEQTLRQLADIRDPDVTENMSSGRITQCASEAVIFSFSVFGCNGPPNILLLTFSQSSVMKICLHDRLNEKLRIMHSYDVEPLTSIGA